MAAERTRRIRRLDESAGVGEAGPLAPSTLDLYY